MRWIVVALALGALTGCQAEAEVEEVTLTKNVTACRHYSDAAQAFSLIVQNDTDAVAKLWQRANCPTFKEGQVVSVTDRRERSVCLRAKGEPDCLWADQTALPRR